MGVALIQKSSCKTSDLSSWISKIRVKKFDFKCQKKRNLLVQAVLTNALARAENELRQKQQERRLRWHNLMSKNAIDPEQCGSKVPSTWDMQTYEEINSGIDAFMNQLKTIKANSSWCVFKHAHLFRINMISLFIYLIAIWTKAVVFYKFNFNWSLLTDCDITYIFLLQWGMYRLLCVGPPKSKRGTHLVCKNCINFFLSFL